MPSTAPPTPSTAPPPIYRYDLYTPTILSCAGTPSALSTPLSTMSIKPRPHVGEQHAPAPQPARPSSLRPEASAAPPDPPAASATDPPRTCTPWVYCLLHLQQLTCTPLHTTAQSLRRRLQSPTALRRPTSNTPPPPPWRRATPLLPFEHEILDLTNGSENCNSEVIRLPSISSH